MSTILLVAGSPNEASRSCTVLEHLAERMAARGVRTDLLRVRELPAPDLIACQVTSKPMRRSVEALELADGVILGTPIYKSSISGLMKLWLDALPQYAFRGKVVLPIATGGSMASMLALDYAIQPVLTSMGSHYALPGFFVLEEWVKVRDAQETGSDSATALGLPESQKQLLDGVLESFLEMLRFKQRGPGAP